ncbi:MAG: MotA/TolQ/ExbB proton channel family protein [Thiovulaceae bacterium]|nr:MotA/TolQ/ExbB proton channel family protein [Sulfurimonadaceae bacterium]
MNFFSDIFAYINSGGFVMWPLAVSIFVLWYGMGFRYNLLKRGNKISVRELIRKYNRGFKKAPTGMIDSAVVEALEIVKNSDPKLARRLLDDAFFEYEQGLKKYKILIKVIVVVAPLAGLLGTVIGMIETFDSLASMSLFSQSGGIAGGISQALFTTQFGLVVAVPGLVVGRMLDKKELTMRNELSQIKDIVLVTNVH